MLVVLPYRFISLTFKSLILLNPQKLDDVSFSNKNIGASTGWPLNDVVRPILLAHLSRRLKGELIVYQSSCCLCVWLCVCLSVCV